MLYLNQVNNLEIRCFLAQRLSTREKLCYGLGDVSNGLAVSSVTVWYQYYLTDVVGLMVGFAAGAVMVGRLWDALTDPIMGWMTDHTKSRWGKRLPYLLFGSVPYAIAYLILWSIPELPSQQQLFIYVTLALILFNTCLTVVFVPYTSLTAAITEDYHERTSITGYRMVCSQVAFLIGATLPPVIVGWFEKSDPNSTFNSFFGSWAATAHQGHMITAAAFGCVMIAAILVTFFGTSERDVREPIQESDSTPLSYASSILEELWGNRPFLIAVLILLLSNCAATLQAVNLPYYLEYVLLLEKSRTSILFTIFAAAIVSVPIWVLITKKYGKAETYRAAMLFYVFFLCGIPFVGTGIANYIYLIAALVGFAYASALTIPWAIIPDVVEYDELKTGQRREGLFYGGTTFSYKAATGIAFFLSGVTLQVFGYTAKVEQTIEAQNAIKFLVGPGPALLLVCAAVLALKYPLTSERHEKILEELAARRKSKATPSTPEDN